MESREYLMSHARKHVPCLVLALEEEGGAEKSKKEPVLEAATAWGFRFVLRWRQALHCSNGYRGSFDLLINALLRMPRFLVFFPARIFESWWFPCLNLHWVEIHFGCLANFGLRVLSDDFVGFLVQWLVCGFRPEDCNLNEACWEIYPANFRLCQLFKAWGTRLIKYLHET